MAKRPSKRSTSSRSTRKRKPRATAKPAAADPPAERGAPPEVPPAPPPTEPPSDPGASSAGPPPGPGAAPPTTGYAVASLILGVLSLCSAGLTAILGLILGIVALARIGSSGGRLRGRGLAIGGIGTSVLGLLLGLMVCGVLVALMAVADRGTGRAEFEMHVRTGPAPGRMAAAVDQMLDASRAYADAHDGRLPEAEAFPRGLEPFLGRGVRMPRGRTVAMNVHVAGRRLADLPDPGRTVVLFETSAGCDRVGGPDLAKPAPGQDTVVVGFADGRVDLVRVGELDRLIWRPEKGEALIL